LIEYNPNTCNINNCDNPQDEYFICDKHKKQYVNDGKLISTLERQKRIIKGNSTLKDKLYYSIYFLIHYSTGIHVKYIEHFPNETIFLHHLPLVYQKKNKKFTTEEFIKDFEFEENYEIDSLKVNFSKDNYKVPLTEYSENKIKTNILKYYAIAFVAYTIFLIAVNLFSLKSFMNSVFIQLELVFFLSYFIIKRGIIFFNKSKELFKLALGDNLYNSKKDNKDFIIESNYTLNKIKSLDENKFIMYGSLVGLSIFGTVSFISQNLDQDYSLFNTFLNIPLVVTSFFMGLILFSYIWNNRFIIPLVRRVKDKSIKFKIYNLSGDLGISILRDFLKTLSNYNLVIILTYVSIEYFFKISKLHFILSYFLLFLISWNMVSYYFIFKIQDFLKNQFKTEVNKEKDKLEGSKARDRFEKHNFLNALKFEIFPLKRTIIRVFKLIYPFIISYIIMKHDKTIMEFAENVFTYFKEK
jgi:hypothetical protein